MKLFRISGLVLTLCVCTMAAQLPMTAYAGPPTRSKPLHAGVGAILPLKATTVLVGALLPPLEKILKSQLLRTQDESVTKVVLDAVTAESKLVIAEQKLHTKDTQFRARWYGSITVKTQVASLATCTVKLSDLHLEWDAPRNTVLVVLPEIGVDAIQIVEWKERVSYTGIGKPFFVDSRNDLAARARSEVAAETRSEAKKQIAEIRTSCVKSLRAALEDKLKDIAPGVHVRVE